MDPSQTDQPVAHARNRVRFEVIFASVWLAFGLFVLPALIYTVGTALLGEYGDNQGLGTFYANFFGDLASLSARAWSLALGPLVLISALRLIFVGTGRKATAEIPPPAPAAAPRREASRVEPRVSLD